MRRSAREEEGVWRNRVWARYERRKAAPMERAKANFRKAIEELFAPLTSRPRLFLTLYIGSLLVILAVVVGAIIGLIPTEGCGLFRASFCR